MHTKTAAHHQFAEACPVPEQWTPANFLPSLSAEHVRVWSIPWVSWHQVSWLCLLPTPCGGVRGKKGLDSKCCATIIKSSLCYQHCISCQFSIFLCLEQPQEHHAVSHGLILLHVGVPQALNRVDTSVSQAALFCTVKQPSPLRFTSFSKGLGTGCFKKKPEHWFWIL